MSINTTHNINVRTFKPQIAKGFSSLLAKVEGDGQIHGVSICKRAFSISYLLFANDSLLFCRANQEEAQAISDVL